MSEGDDISVERPDDSYPEATRKRLAVRPARRGGGLTRTGPLTELTGRMRLLVSYMVYGCQHRDLCEAFGVEPDTPLSLTAAGDILGFRRKQGRELFSERIFQQALTKAVGDLRTAAAPKAMNRIIGLVDSDGDAASKKIALEASRTILGSDEVKRAAVTVNVGVGVQAGYIIDLSPQERPPAIEGKALAGEPLAVLPTNQLSARAVRPGGELEAPISWPDPVSRDLRDPYRSKFDLGNRPPFCPKCGTLYARGRSCGCEG
jgi:hypothetical protein